MREKERKRRRKGEKTGKGKRKGKNWEEKEKGRGKRDRLKKKEGGRKRGMEEKIGKMDLLNVHKYVIIKLSVTRTHQKSKKARTPPGPHQFGETVYPLVHPVNKA